MLPGSADKVMVNSNYTAEVYNHTFTRIAARVRPEVLYPAINFQAYDQTYRNPQFPWVPPMGLTCTRPYIRRQREREPLFVSLNRYERKKNIALALEAFALLREQMPSVFPSLRLVIAGRPVFVVCIHTQT